MQNHLFRNNWSYGRRKETPINLGIFNGLLYFPATKSTGWNLWTNSFVLVFFLFVYLFDVRGVSVVFIFRLCVCLRLTRCCVIMRSNCFFCSVFENTVHDIQEKPTLSTAVCFNSTFVDQDQHSCYVFAPPSIGLSSALAKWRKTRLRLVDWRLLSNVTPKSLMEFNCSKICLVSIH